MIWYIPILAALVGVIGGWIIRHFYDARVERAVLRRELFRDYMRFVTDGLSGLVALQRIGALRLPRKEFDSLVREVTRCGHPPERSTDSCTTGGVTTVYDLLVRAAAKEIEVPPGAEAYELMKEMCLDDSDTATPEKTRREGGLLRRGRP